MPPRLRRTTARPADPVAPVTPTVETAPDAVLRSALIVAPGRTRALFTTTDGVTFGQEMASAVYAAVPRPKDTPVTLAAYAAVPGAELTPAPATFDDQYQWTPEKAARLGLG